jgi:hypothetical protein
MMVSILDALGDRVSLSCYKVFGKGGVQQETLWAWCRLSWAHL